MKDFAITNNNHSNLDGVRAIGILMVVVKHFFENFINLQFCWVSIDLLFALSGLLITGILIESKEDNRYFQKFYMRRILRIFPLYYFLILLFTGYIYFITNHPGAFTDYKNNIGYFLTYTQNWYFINHGLLNEAHINHTWSLAIDEQIYIVWPLLIWLCKNQKQLTILCGSVLLFSLFYRIGYNIYLETHSYPHPYPYFHNTLCRIDSFGAGALLYCLIKFESRWLKAKNMLYVSVVSLLLFIVFALIGGSVYHTNYYMKNFGITIIGIHFATWLYFAITRKYSLLNSFFSSRILVYIGKISYSLYVYHWFLLILLLPTLHGFLSRTFQVTSLLPASILCLLITFIVSILSYTWFEKPIIKLKRKFSYSKTSKINAG